MESVKRSRGLTFEIIIITSDETLALKGIPGCVVSFCSGMPAEKRNRGSRIAKSRYLGFFDDDVEITTDCLVHLKNILDGDKKCAMVYGKLYKADAPGRLDEAGGFITSTGFIWSRAGQNIEDTGQFDNVEKILAGKSASCMVYKPAFDAVGGFDEDFEILGEETDLSWRIWLSGGFVAFAPEATGIHYFNTKFKPAKEYYTSKRVHYNGCRNYVTMLLKNLGTEHLWIVPIHCLIWFTASLAMIGTLKVRQGWNIMQGLGYCIKNIGAIVRKRKKVQEERETLEKDLWPLIHRKAPRGYAWQRFTRYIRTCLHG